MNPPTALALSLGVPWLIAIAAALYVAAVVDRAHRLKGSVLFDPDSSTLASDEWRLVTLPFVAANVALIGVVVGTVALIFARRWPASCWFGLLSSAIAWVALAVSVSMSEASASW